MNCSSSKIVENGTSSIWIGQRARGNNKYCRIQTLWMPLCLEELISERIVESIKNTISNQFLHPFDKQLDDAMLYNLVSGLLTSECVIESLMSLEENGMELKREFEKRIIGTSDLLLFSPIKKHPILKFESTNKTVVVEKNGKQKEIACQRDILGHLVSLFYTSKSGIDLEKVLSYPLASVSVPISTYDGTIRKTVKVSCIKLRCLTFKLSMLKTYHRQTI